MQLRLLPGAHIVAVAIAPLEELLDEVRTCAQKSPSLVLLGVMAWVGMSRVGASGSWCCSLFKDVTLIFRRWLLVRGGWS